VASGAEHLLSPGELVQLRDSGYLDVASPSRPKRVYRIPAGGGQVAVFDYSKEIMRLCLQPIEPLNTIDLVVLHKLLILADERVYLATANRFPPSRQWQPGELDPLIALAQQPRVRATAPRRTAPARRAPRDEGDAGVPA
jgi:hypothetical protein